MKSTTGGFRLMLVLCVAGAGMMFLPVEASLPIRAVVRDALSPGQIALRAGLTRSGGCADSLKNALRTTSQSPAAEEQLRAARLVNRSLELQVALLRERLQKLADQQGLTPLTGAPPPLLTPALVEARVLGDETAALWRGRKLLSVGATGGIVESTLVLDDTRPLVDQGADAGLSPGDAACAGRIVIGKIAEVGRWTSTLRLVTDPAYSGRARLARRTSRGLVFGAEGTLVGDGGDLCRLKHIADPVNIDDEVFTGGADGLIPFPMYYGKVVRAELDPQAKEWSVWVKPAAGDERLERVLILRRAINSDRNLAN